MATLKSTPLRKLLGHPVRLVRKLETNGGRVFEEGQIMYIASKRGGWGLAETQEGGFSGSYDIRKVSESDFYLISPRAGE